MEANVYAKPMTTDICAYCRERKADTNPKRCGYRDTRGKAGSPHRFEAITMDPRIQRVVQDWNLLTAGGFTPNFEYGADLNSIGVHLVTDDYGEAVILKSYSEGSLDFQVTFDAGTPREVIYAALLAI